jgi:thioredoxin-like negative regulator of GroEL
MAALRVCVSLLLLTLAGCEHYERPQQPLASTFQVTTLDGARMDRASFAGTPWVIAIWVPGCSSCNKELPLLEALRREYEPLGVGFLALSIEPDEKVVEAAARKLGLAMTVATTRDEVLAPLRVNAVPSTVFVDASGTIVAAASGLRKRSFLEARVRALLDPLAHRGPDARLSGSP